MSDSPTCSEELNLPRTNWFQVSSARMRALMVLGEMPERSSDLGELLRRDALALGHVVERLVDLRVAHFEAIAFGLRDLEPVVDQFVDDLLAGGSLVGRCGDQLGALLDVVVR